MPTQQSKSDWEFTCASQYAHISIISDSISLLDQARIGFDDLRFLFQLFSFMYIYTIYISFW